MIIAKNSLQINILVEGIYDTYTQILVPLAYLRWQCSRVSNNISHLFFIVCPLCDIHLFIWDVQRIQYSEDLLLFCFNLQI